MSIIKKDTVLSEVLAQHHILIPIINRFGIKLGEIGRASCRERV